MLKKITKLILFLGVFTSSFMLVKASNLVLENIPNLYYTRKIDGVYSSNIYSSYLMDGEVVYCIEPGYTITDYNYIGVDDLDNFQADSNTKRLLKLIGYYGYEYPGHEHVYYQAATQALIWELFGVKDIEFYTKRYGYGTLIDLSSYKKEIMYLVNQHDLKPDFPSNITGYLGKEIILEDKNKILDEYEVVDNQDILIKDNKLIIKCNKEGKEEIILKRKKYDNKRSILYEPTDGKSQRLAILRFDDDVTFKIKLIIKSGSITLEKLNADTSNNLTRTGTSLENAIYGLYDNLGNLVTTLKTNKEGKVTVSNLKIGEYQLKELEASLGFTLDLNTYQVTIDEYNLSNQITVLEKPIKKKVKVLKIDLETGLNIPISGIKFKIKDLETNTYLDYIYETKEDGTFETNYLPYGKYQLEELDQTIPGYVVNKEPLIFQINEEDLILKYANKAIKGSLELLKVDSKTGLPLKDALIGIYKDNKLIYEIKTNELGKINISNLKYGDYYLMEIKPPLGYYLNTNKITFNIQKDQDIIEIKLENEPVIIEVPNTASFINNKSKILSLLLASIGISCLVLKKE